MTHINPHTKIPQTNTFCNLAKSFQSLTSRKNKSAFFHATERSVSLRYSCVSTAFIMFTHEYHTRNTKSCDDKKHIKRWNSERRESIRGGLKNNFTNRLRLCETPSGRRYLLLIQMRGEIV